jgi:HEAT repeat protein
VVKALQEALQDQDGKIRALAAGSLIRLGPLAKAALPQLLEILKENNSDMQEKALTAIMAIRDRRDFELCDSLGLLNESGQWAQARPFPQSALKAIPAQLSDPNPTRRLTAALALGRIGPAANGTLPLLKKLLADQNLVVQAAAHLAISRIEAAPGNKLKKVDDIIQDAILNQKGRSDPAELVRLHILLSTIPSLPAGTKGADQDLKDSPAKSRPIDRKGLDHALSDSLAKSRQWVREKLDGCRFDQENLANLLEGINQAAQWDLGFTEPFTFLSFKLQNVVHESKDPLLAVHAFNNIGNGVPPESHYWHAIKQQWAELISKVPLDFLILEQTQKVQRTALVVSKSTPVGFYLKSFG